MNDSHSLSHTKWNCNYHIVFCQRSIGEVSYDEKRLEIEAILRELRKWKGVNILETETCPDHIHAARIPLKMSVSRFMGYLEGKSSLMIMRSGVTYVQISK